MRRRDFITGLVATTTIGRAQAQQKARIYRLAVATPTLMMEIGGRYTAFLKELQRLAYVEGQNLIIERYSAEGREERFAELAAQVVRSNPDLIFVVSARLTLAFKTATATVPVVALISDPLAYGIVKSLARPGGNITGTTVDAGVEIESKRLELLREMVPAVSRVAYLASSRVWESPSGAKVQEAAQRMKMSLIGPPLEAPFGEAEYRQVFAAMGQAGADALFVADQPENLTNRRLIVELAEKARLPAVYSSPLFVDIGGLMSYATDGLDVYRHAADQVAAILSGAKPGDIPFYQPTKFTLVINLKTANALGLPVPDSLLAQADEVVE